MQLFVRKIRLSLLVVSWVFISLEQALSQKKNPPFFKEISKVYPKAASSSALLNIDLSENHWGTLSYLKSTIGKLRDQKKCWSLLDKEHWAHSYSFVKLGEDMWLTGSWQHYKGAQGSSEAAGAPCWAWCIWSMKSWQHSHCRLHWCCCIWAHLPSFKGLGSHVPFTYQHLNISLWKGPEKMKRTKQSEVQI